MKMGNKEQMVKIHRLAMKNQKKALIDKACKWFENNFYNGDMHLLEELNGGYREAYDICCGFESIQEMVNDFHKAMEE